MGTFLYLRAFLKRDGSLSVPARVIRERISGRVPVRRSWLKTEGLAGVSGGLWEDEGDRGCGIREARRRGGDLCRG
jgi:hypothetical protein